MDEEQRDADRFVSFAYDAGVNYFDVAPSYGNAEQRLGPALEPYRDRVFLACKTQERSAEGSRKELLRSLENLRTDHFDVYQMHAVSTLADIDGIFAENGALETFIRAREEGLIRFIGITAHNAELAAEAVSRFEFDTVMLPVNWALGLGTDFEKTLPEICAAKNIGLLGMKTLAHRRWREGEERVYPKSWCKIIFGDEPLGRLALKYTISRGAHAVVPPGNFDSFEFCVGHIDECADNPLSAGDIDYLKSALPDNAEMIFETPVD
jgi:aryl-alcohol dehydrogenase-like predicted oxidoreductase